MNGYLLEHVPVGHYHYGLLLLGLLLLLGKQEAEAA